MAAISARRRVDDDRPRLMLGGFAALAESAWMGAAQASDILEPLRLVTPLRQRIGPRSWSS